MLQKKPNFFFFIIYKRHLFTEFPKEQIKSILFAVADWIVSMSV